MSTEKKHYTHQQIKLIVLLNILMLLVGAGYSLLAPFYPREAERKNASPSVLGIIIGIYHLINFLLAPIYGKYVKHIGAKFLFNAGIYTIAVSTALFGLLERSPAGSSFIVMSFVLRITEALGHGAFMTGSYAIAAHEFQDDIASTFSYLQSSFSAGMIVGPTFGGYLFELNPGLNYIEFMLFYILCLMLFSKIIEKVGRFLLPFATAGILIFIGALATSFILPQITYEESRTNTNILPLLKRPSALISVFSLFSLFFSFGFINSFLESHLRQFNLRPVVLGLMFIIEGMVNVFTNRLWGFLAKKYKNLKLLSAIGGAIIAFGFSFIGPLSFFPIEPQLWIIATSLGGFSIGIGGEILIPFLDIIDEARRIGYQNNITTSGIASGIWTSTASLGLFIGPTLGGLLFETIGFRNCTIVIVSMHCIVVLLNLMFWIYEKQWKLNNENDVCLNNNYGTI